MKSNNPPGDLTDSVHTFARATPELLRRDMLEFVYEEVRVPGRFRRLTHTALVEQRIVDEAGRCVGRVSEQPPARGLTLERGGYLDRPVRAAMYDSGGAKVLEFSGFNGLRRFLGRSLDWGRRLDVADSAGQSVGTLVVGGLWHRGTVYGRSSERIGAIRQKSRGYIHFALLDSRSKEVGWIADSATHARRLGSKPIVSSRSGVKEWWTMITTPKHHFLGITSDVDHNLRLMMLAASAAVHLVLSRFSVEGE